MAEYTIHGGDKGKKRLEILAQTIGAETHKFFKTAGINKGISCLDLGCGGGDVSFLLSQFVGENGNITGYDIDSREIELAKKLLNKSDVNNVSFEVKDAYDLDEEMQYDLVYSRFLLSHLKDPLSVLKKICTSLKNGGKVLIEDTDFSGHFSYPRSKAFDLYVSLYQDLLNKRGANANLGQKLSFLLSRAGFEKIEFYISQPAHIKGEGKLMAEITFEGISESLIEERIISKDEINEILKGIIEFRKRNDTIMSLPRIFQLQAIKPFPRSTPNAVP